MYYGDKMAVGTSRITQKGQITIPSEIRKHLGLKTGTNIVFIELEDGILIKSEDKLREMFRPYDDIRKETGLTRDKLAGDVKKVRRERFKRRKS
jgi:AbrB family looped-hinge helix DNA binding protein